MVERWRRGPAPALVSHNEVPFLAMEAMVHLVLNPRNPCI